MGMINCKECNQSISSNANTCPNCGMILKKKTGCLTYFIGIFLIIIVFAAIGSTSKTVTSNVVTLEEYTQIKSGMSYDEVVNIIGEEGSEMSSNEMPGNDYMPPMKTIMYMWQNSNGSNMNAMFQNDKLVNKAQAQLK